MDDVRQLWANARLNVGTRTDADDRSIVLGLEVNSDI